MNPIYAELLNIFLLLFITVDYYRKYNKKINNNSYIWFFACLFVFLLSILNIILYSIKDIYCQNILFIIGYIIAVIPVIVYSKYIDMNYISNEKDKLKDKHFLIYLILYMFIVISYFIKNPLENIHINSLTEYNGFPILFGFITLPLLYLLGKCVFKRVLEIRIYFAVILPITGGVLSIILKEGSFLTFFYSFSLLLLYMFKYDSVINKDSLTGANNRRFFDNYVYSGDKKYAVYMIDLDDFKKVNDTYGHDEGDKVLMEFVEVLKSSIRTTDSVIRLGGDEFAVITTMKNDNDIKVIYNRINNNIKKYNDIHRIPISLSIGYGLYSSDMDFKTFLNDLDKKMYKNKQGKKNEKKKNKNSI